MRLPEDGSAVRNKIQAELARLSQLDVFFANRVGWVMQVIDRYECERTGRSGTYVGKTFSFSPESNQALGHRATGQLRTMG
jgi:hypothetical protein